MSAADRTCPACRSESLLSVKEARAVYGSLSRFGADALLDDADRLCEFCHVARLDSGEWERLESVSQVAYDKSRTGNKSKADYKDKLTRGSLPTGGSDSSDSGGRVEDTGRNW